MANTLIRTVTRQELWNPYCVCVR